MAKILVFIALAIFVILLIAGLVVEKKLSEWTLANSYTKITADSGGFEGVPPFSATARAFGHGVASERPPRF